MWYPMICHLNYTIDKEYYKNYFFDNYDKGDWHRRGDKILKIWWKMFGIDEVVKPITYDLGIENLNIKPRFSYQLPNTSLKSHIDEDRIVAINLNLLDEKPEIILENKTYSYENALIDVGTKIHSVIAKDKPRLVLKYAIRNKWEDIYNILDKKGLIDHTKTYLDNPNYGLYESKFIPFDKQFIYE